MWKGNGNRSTLLITFLEGLEILHQERRGQVTVVTEHFNNILFHKSEPANKKHAY
jgi:hypothetical protein